MVPRTDVLQARGTSNAAGQSPAVSAEVSSFEGSTVPPRQPRRSKLSEARPFSDFLTDTYHRQHDYLRISLTERCNLRCVYCMPEEGVPLSPQRDLLTTPEIVLLSSVFVSQGVSKIRLTGGEPTVRQDILPLMRQIGALRRHGLRELCLTTNGLALHRKLDSMVQAGLTGVNLSLDTLDPWQFQIMTRRKGFDAVMRSIDKIFELNSHGAGIKFKINCVVMRGINEREILRFVEMTREKDVEVRFIEYMPFDGNKWDQRKMYSYTEMLDLIRAKYAGLHQVPGHKNDTSKTWKIPGFVGRLGFITSMTHNFCGTCNRLRITNDGNLKVCLFGNAEVSLRDILRRSNDGEPIDEAAFETMKKVDMARRQGLTAPTKPPGITSNERELLEIIGVAVKRKKERHAGLEELQHMKNRPMILIDPKRSWHSKPARPVAGTTMSHEATWASRMSRSNSIVPFQMLPQRHTSNHLARWFTSFCRAYEARDKSKLSHVSESGSAHMVSINDKTSSIRTAKAVCFVVFSDDTAISLIKENQTKKGDVIGVARIAGIMAAKRTPDLIPLCHPILISNVTVDLSFIELGTTHEDRTGGPRPAHRIKIESSVSCEGKTGVEMEALTAASTAALTVYDMCKAIDKGMIIQGLRVVLKEGGQSGTWVDGQRRTRGP